jgi:hypothetical protein
VPQANLARYSVDGSRQGALFGAGRARGQSLAVHSNPMAVLATARDVEVGQPQPLPALWRAVPLPAGDSESLPEVREPDLCTCSPGCW